MGFHLVVSAREREKNITLGLSKMELVLQIYPFGHTWREHAAISAMHCVLPFLKQPRSSVDKVKHKKKTHPRLTGGRELKD